MTMLALLQHHQQGGEQSRDHPVASAPAQKREDRQRVQ
jgi:hypothetical protein